MKKSVITLALLSAFSSVVYAQTNVTLYGVVDAGISYKNDGNPNGNTVGLTSGQQAGSRLGFKGKEDLGGGLSAIFTLETGINLDDGTTAQGNKATGTSRLFGRQAWVGLDGGFGAVKFGRQQTSLFHAQNQIDPFRKDVVGGSQKVFGYGLYASDPLSRTDNTVSYSTPSINGLSATVSYGFGEQAGDSSAKRNVGVGASYANGPLNVQFAYQEANDAPLFAGEAANSLLGATAADIEAAFIGATYDFGVVKAHAAFADNKLKLAAQSTKTRDYLVGISAPVGAAGTVLASYAHNDVRDLPDGTSDQYSLGYRHELSKRTSLYTTYSHTKNDNDVALNTAGGNVFGHNVNQFSVGVTHQF